MRRLSIGILAIYILAFAAAASAAEVSGDAYVSVYSKYLWRGQDLSPGDNFVVQPGTTLNMNHFSIGWWGNISENTGELNEVDLTVEYSRDLNDFLSISAGNLLYDVDGVATTNELYLGASLETLLSPSLKVYYDYDEAEETGLFFTLSVGHAFPITGKATLNLCAAAGYNAESDALVGDYNDFQNGEASVILDYAATDNLTLGALALYSTPLSNDAKEKGDIHDKATVALSASFSF